jgi:hypothetical protein
MGQTALTTCTQTHQVRLQRRAGDLSRQDVLSVALDALHVAVYKLHLNKGLRPPVFSLDSFPLLDKLLMTEYQARSRSSYG